MSEPEQKKKPKLSESWRETKELVAAHRGRLVLSLALMMVSRLVGS